MLLSIVLRSEQTDLVKEILAVEIPDLSQEPNRFKENGVPGYGIEESANFLKQVVDYLDRIKDIPESNDEDQRAFEHAAGIIREINRQGQILLEDSVRIRGYLESFQTSKASEEGNEAAQKNKALEALMIAFRKPTSDSDLKLALPEVLGIKSYLLAFLYQKYLEMSQNTFVLSKDKSELEYLKLGFITIKSPWTNSEALGKREYQIDSDARRKRVYGENALLKQELQEFQEKDEYKPISDFLSQDISVLQARDKTSSISLDETGAPAELNVPKRLLALLPPETQDLIAKIDNLCAKVQENITQQKKQMEDNQFILQSLELILFFLADSDAFISTKSPEDVQKTLIQHINNQFKLIKIKASQVPELWKKINELWNAVCTEAEAYISEETSEPILLQNTVFPRSISDFTPVIHNIANSLYASIFPAAAAQAKADKEQTIKENFIQQVTQRVIQKRHVVQEALTHAIGEREIEIKKAQALLAKLEEIKNHMSKGFFSKEKVQKLTALIEKISQSEEPVYKNDQLKTQIESVLGTKRPVLFSFSKSSLSIFNEWYENEFLLDKPAPKEKTSSFSFSSFSLGSFSLSKKPSTVYTSVSPQRDAPRR